MSRGLGKTQRAVLDMLRQHTHGCEMTELARRVFHPDTYPADELFDADMGEHQRQYWKVCQLTTRAQYVSVFRAVQTLERAGLVETEIKIPKPIMGYRPPGSVRWKLVKLSVDRQ